MKWRGSNKDRHMWNTYDDYQQYVIRVIHSCTTMAQIDNCRRWIWYMGTICAPELSMTLEKHMWDLVRNHNNPQQLHTGQ